VAQQTAQQIVQVLSSYTREGTIFPVDARLRPRGGEGELVITPAQLETYARGEAQAWEALTYTKLRFIAGSPELARRTRTFVRDVAARFAADPEFISGVREIRSRLEKSDSTPRNLKTAAGALYDIDFIVGSLLVRHQGNEFRGTMRDSLRLACARRWLSGEDRATLDRAAALLRTLEHLVRIVTGRPRKTVPSAGHAREIIEQLASRMLGRSLYGNLDAELDETFGQVRAIYERLVA
jgi:glutamate-ammonia-ligase adenylyltransferase